MSRLSEIGESAAQTILDRVGRGVSEVQERTPLPYDLLESDEAYLIIFDAPGIEQTDVQVQFLDGKVEVRFDRFRDFYEDFEMRFPGRGLALDGSVSLPDDATVDPEHANATLGRNGILKIRLPKDGRQQTVTVSEEDEEVDTDDAGKDSADTGEADVTDSSNDNDV
ncbi:Hsp20/alpha crystallin family protein [Haloquadratum walsbyi]|jgi:Molecular chaperone (small heat shock protein)|uniref:Molecular chaperone, small heat shock protein n=1 Tax=Haloquadratum walsbyi J07HQW2 TaxID=1238425 RepID=U1NH35_9EURY|nr:Hsp20/alpha crystallin family protein [Haloquadratum walsbyi]ERG96455.1 MAG: molecular chaperone, small heat shock protein [Haloquadratum walsbyi J07HQW2]